MHHRSLAGAGSFLALILWLAAAPCLAQAPDSDPPGRVARLSYLQGEVSLQPAGLTEWAGAVINRPLTTGDKLWADENSRAELQLGTLAVRLGAATGFSFLNLDDRAVQMQVTAGTIEVSVRELGEGETLEVDTPTLAMTVLQPGTYRIEVDESGNTTSIKVPSGAAEVTGGGDTYQIHTQERATFTDTGGLTADTATLGAPDEFDAWCLQRDQRDERAVASAAQYVSPDVPGAEDLGDYGTWQSVPDYGPVWVPTAVAVGWAPYHFGHWVWVAPWGWTWVDDAPWGFAPFHYGRWAHLRGSWCWVPGPRRPRPVYAPALVAWVGGPHFNLSVSAGGIEPGVAWFPLGPREVFVPGYHGSERYVRNVNITNTTIANTAYITNVVNNRVDVRYANRQVPGALTAVSRTAFTTAQPVGSHAIRLNEGQLAATRASTLTPGIEPGRASLLGAAAAAGAVRRHVPPPRFESRTVVARLTPPPAPVAFDRQRDAIRANGGRPLAPAQLAPLQSRTPLPFRPANQPSPGRAALAPRAIEPRAFDRPNTAPRTVQPAERANAQSFSASGAPAQTPPPRIDRPSPAFTPREDRPPRTQPSTPPSFQAPPDRPAFRAERNERGPPPSQGESQRFQAPPQPRPQPHTEAPAPRFQPPPPQPRAEPRAQPRPPPPPPPHPAQETRGSHDEHGNPDRDRQGPRDR